MEANTESITAELLGLLSVYNKDNIALTPQTNLTSELNIDSVEVMNLIMEVEDRFNISIPINLVADVQTVEDLARLVGKQLAGG